MRGVLQLTICYILGENHQTELFYLFFCVNCPFKVTYVYLKYAVVLSIFSHVEYHPGVQSQSFCIRPASMCFAREILSPILVMAPNTQINRA